MKNGFGRFNGYPLVYVFLCEVTYVLNSQVSVCERSKEKQLKIQSSLPSKKLCSMMAGLGKGATFSGTN